MALLKRLYETQATRRHKTYQKYVKGLAKGVKPMSFSMWAGSSSRPGLKRRKKTPVEKPKKPSFSLLVDYARRTGKPKRKN